MNYNLDLLCAQLESNLLHVLDLSCNRIVDCFILTSIQTRILATKELLYYPKHLNQTHLSLCLISTVRTCCFISFSLNTENNITPQGAMKLSEALKSNSSLTSLNLRCNSFVASFHSHSVQTTMLVLKEP
jgi:hypothetical protein